MADFAAVLRKAVEALKENTPEARQKIYEKARATVEAKLASATPPPPAELAARQKGLLEDAIARVESEYAPPPPAPESQEDDLESLFADLDAQLPTRTASAAPVRASEPPEAIEPTPASDVQSAPDAPQPAPAAWDGGPEEEEARREAAQESPEPERAPLQHEEPEVHWGGPAAESEPPEGAPVADDFDRERAAAPEEPAVYGPEAHEDAPADWPPAETHGPEALDDDAVPPPAQPPLRARRSYGKLVLLLLGLIVIGGAAYGGWLFREDLARLADFGGQDGAPAQQAEAEPSPASTGDETGEAVANPEAGQSEAPRKFTQRLTADGREVDEGPAGGAPTLGEGTSIAAATQTGTPPVQDDSSGQEASDGVPIGQSAIFYEERTSVSQSSATRGSVVWSVSEESPGDNLPPEPTVQADASIPEKGLQLKLTIRRNVDQSLPASHIIELIFLTPSDFPGGSINSVSRIAMKRNEQDPGSPLLGIPAKIADGFFLVALSDRQADISANSRLLERENWIDIPIVYSSGRRALITLEKGVPGERIFRDAVQSWQSAATASGG